MLSEHSSKWILYNKANKYDNGATKTVVLKNDLLTLWKVSYGVASYGVTFQSVNKSS